MQLKRYWVSWYEYEKDYRPLKDPPNAGILGWWCSGHSDTNSTLCALVQCESKAEVVQALGEDWPQESLVFDMRFIEPVEMDYRPSDRFVLTDWMKERINAIPTS